MRTALHLVEVLAVQKLISDLVYLSKMQFIMSPSKS
jgi:hypothetical protein